MFVYETVFTIASNTKTINMEVKLPLKQQQCHFSTLDQLVIWEIDNECFNVEISDVLTEKYSSNSKVIVLFFKLKVRSQLRNNC